MRIQLIKSMEKNDCLIEIVYIAKNDVITKRKVRVLQVDEYSFSGYCYLRKSTRTFKISNILALVPVPITSRERAVV